MGLEQCDGEQITFFFLAKLFLNVPVNLKVMSLHTNKLFNKNSTEVSICLIRQSHKQVWIDTEEEEKCACKVI